MTKDQETVTLVIRKPLPVAVKSIRRVLAESGLEIVMELDLAGRVHKTLNMDIAPCRVLYVDCPVSLLEAIALDRSAAVVLPLHIVVSAQTESTVVYLLNPATTLYQVIPVTAKAAVSKLQARVLESLSSLSVRHDPLEFCA